MKTIATIAATIYTETAALYAEIKQQLNGAALGYKVLYGPPLVSPPVFILGLQVGGVALDQRGNELVTWPAETEYATAQWPFAQKLRGIFEPDFLKTTTGSNVNFFRARSDREYEAHVPLALGQKCEKFIQERARTLVEASNPERIIVFGVKVLEKLRVTHQFRDVAHALKRGELWGRPTMATWHLTGQCQAQVTNEQRTVIYRALREFAGVKLNAPTAILPLELARPHRSASVLDGMHPLAETLKLLIERDFSKCMRRPGPTCRYQHCTLTG